MIAAPLPAVDPEHIGAVRLCNRDTIKILFNEVRGKVHISLDDLPQFIDPDHAVVTVSADQGVHGQDIHIIIMGQR